VDDLLTWLRAEIRKDIAGAEKLLEEGSERRWYDRYHCVYPRDLIARGQTELALLDEHAIESTGFSRYCRVCSEYSTKPGESSELEPAPAPCRTVRLLVSGYQNRSGFKPSWLD